MDRRNKQGGKHYGELKQRQDSYIDAINRDILLNDDFKFIHVPSLRERLVIYKNKFMEFDEDHSGGIDFFEMKQMLEKLGQPRTHLEAKKLMKDLDREGTGSISYRAFVDMLLGNVLGAGILFTEEEELMSSTKAGPRKKRQAPQPPVQTSHIESILKTQQSHKQVSFQNNAKEIRPQATQKAPAPRSVTQHESEDEGIDQGSDPEVPDLPERVSVSDSPPPYEADPDALAYVGSTSRAPQRRQIPIIEAHVLPETNQAQQNSCTETTAPGLTSTHDNNAPPPPAPPPVPTPEQQRLTQTHMPEQRSSLNQVSEPSQDEPSQNLAQQHEGASQRQASETQPQSSSEDQTPGSHQGVSSQNAPSPATGPSPNTTRPQNSGAPVSHGHPAVTHAVQPGQQIRAPFGSQLLHQPLPQTRPGSVTGQGLGLVYSGPVHNNMYPGGYAPGTQMYIQPCTVPGCTDCPKVYPNSLPGQEAQAGLPQYNVAPQQVPVMAYAPTGGYTVPVALNPAGIPQPQAVHAVHYNNGHLPQAQQVIYTGQMQGITGSMANLNMAGPRYQGPFT